VSQKPCYSQPEKGEIEHSGALETWTTGRNAGPAAPALKIEWRNSNMKRRGKRISDQSMDVRGRSESEYIHAERERLGRAGFRRTKTVLGGQGLGEGRKAGGLAPYAGAGRREGGFRIVFDSPAAEPVRKARSGTGSQDKISEKTTRRGRRKGEKRWGKELKDGANNCQQGNTKIPKVRVLQKEREPTKTGAIPPPGEEGPIPGARKPCYEREVGQVRNKLPREGKGEIKSTCI